MNKKFTYNLLLKICRDLKFERSSINSAMSRDSIFVSSKYKIFIQYNHDIPIAYNRNNGFFIFKYDDLKSFDRKYENLIYSTWDSGKNNTLSFLQLVILEYYISMKLPERFI